jgi:hypothetical protein
MAFLQEAREDEVQNMTEAKGKVRRELYAGGAAPMRMVRGT